MKTSYIFWMKRLAILISFSSFSTSAQAILLKYDGFNYTAGNLNQANGTAWFKTGTGDTIQVVDNSLSYPGFAASTGRKAQWGGDGGNSRTEFTAVTSGSAFASFLFKVDTLAPLTTADSGLVGMFNQAAENSPNSRVYIRRDLNNANAFNLGILERGSAITWSSQQLSAGSTHLIVFSLDFIAGDNNDVARLWINPGSASFGAASAPTPTVTASGGIDATQVSRFRLIQGAFTAGLMSADELRIGTTWADVVVPAAAVPEPTSYALLAGILASFRLVVRRRR